MSLTYFPITVDDARPAGPRFSAGPLKLSFSDETKQAEPSRAELSRVEPFRAPFLQEYLLRPLNAGMWNVGSRWRSGLVVFRSSFLAGTSSQPTPLLSFLSSSAKSKRCRESRPVVSWSLVGGFFLPVGGGVGCCKCPLARRAGQLERYLKPQSCH